MEEVIDRSIEAQSVRTCRCGFHKHHVRVVPRCKYAWHAILRLLLGVTAYPKEVYYQCERCEQIIERTTDIAVRRLHV